MNEHIKLDLDPFIKDEEWDNWLAGKKIWEEWLKNNEKDSKKTAYKK